MTKHPIRILAWLGLAAIIFVTVSPIELRPHDIFPVNFDRALAFGLMATLFMMAYPRHWRLVAVALILASGGIELLQELSPTRHAKLDDASIKAAGASVGIAVGYLVNVYLGRRVA